ncbi:MAG: putative Ig domain-containing protein [Bacteroidota bacterium]|jgi:hypothetical protein
MKEISFIGLLILLVTVCYGQAIPDSALYLGQTPPGNTPKIFQLPVSSGLFAAERIAISNDGKEIYYNELNGYPPSISRIKYCEYSNNKWNGPYTLFENYGAPGLSIDGRTLFLEGGWQSVKSDTGWSTPLKFWNTSKKIHYLQATNSGNYYLTSNPVITNNGDISKLIMNGTNTTAQTLGVPVNSASNGIDFFISRNESYIIFVIRINQLGNLFISYHQTGGKWTNPKNLGAQINASQAWEWGPYVTNDNKYLFFTRQSSTTDIYWVKVDSLIDSLKHTNFVPYVKNPIHSQTAIKDSSFNYQIPDSTFIDDDGNNTLTYSATLINGNPLPAWLSFDPATRTFSGTPTAAATISIKVTATDTASASVSSTFNIISVLTGVNQEENKTPKDFNLD